MLRKLTEPFLELIDITPASPAVIREQPTNLQKIAIMKAPKKEALTSLIGEFAINAFTQLQEYSRQWVTEAKQGRRAAEEAGQEKEEINTELAQPYTADKQTSSDLEDVTKRLEQAEHRLELVEDDLECIQKEKEELKETCRRHVLQIDDLKESRKDLWDQKTRLEQALDQAGKPSPETQEARAQCHELARELETVRREKDRLEADCKWAETSMRAAEAEYRRIDRQLEAMKRDAEQHSPQIQAQRDQVAERWRRLETEPQRVNEGLADLRWDILEHPQDMPPRAELRTHSSAYSEHHSPLHHHDGTRRGDRGIDQATIYAITKTLSPFDPVTQKGLLASHMREINNRLASYPQATAENRADILRRTSTLELCGCIDRQPPEVRKDFKALCAALRREFEDDHDEIGSIAALTIVQGPKEHPAAYYKRLRNVYFKSENEVYMEEGLNFKGLFMNNLNQATKRELGVYANPRTMAIHDLRDLAVRAFNHTLIKNPGTGSRPAQRAEGRRVHGPETWETDTVVMDKQDYERLVKRARRQAKRERQDRTPDSGHTITDNSVLMVQMASEPVQAPTRPAKETGAQPFKQLLGHLTARGTNGKLFLPVKLENLLTLEALVDTAADYTLISATTLEELKRRAGRTNKDLKLEQCDLEIGAYSTVGTRVKALAQLRLTVGEVTLSHPVYVSPLESPELLLGADFLNLFEPLLDFQRLTIWSQVREPMAINHGRQQTETAAPRRTTGRTGGRPTKVSGPAPGVDVTPLRHTQARPRFVSEPRRAAPAKPVPHLPGPEVHRGGPTVYAHKRGEELRHDSPAQPTSWRLPREPPRHQDKPYEITARYSPNAYQAFQNRFHHTPGRREGKPRFKVRRTTVVDCWKRPDRWAPPTPCVRH